MITFYFIRFAQLRRISRITWRWVRRHPRWSVVIALGIWFIVAEAGGTVLIAQADNGTISSLPWLSPLSAKDSGGVDLLHYATLPLDRGDAWTWDKSFISSIVDPLWVFHLAAVSWVLWLFQFLLSFQWVDWLATPIGAIATFISGIVSQIGWLPLALAAVAVICGAFIMGGKVAKGVIEIAISVAASVLAVTLLANPVAALTGPNGALPWVESWGGTLAASIASDNPSLSVNDPSSTDASKALSDTLIAQLMDIWVRYPAQEVAFGHTLTGDCSTVFSDAMKKVNPIDRGDTSVRDAVHNCDPAAWDYVTNPGFGQVATVFIIQMGADILMLLGLAFSLVLMMSVGYALGQALKLTGVVYAAVAPGVARGAFWKSLIGMYTAVLSVGFSVVMLSGFLRIITAIMTSAAGASLPIVAQMLIVDLVVIVLIISMFVLRHQAKKAGETLAQRLSRIGFGSKSPERRPSPVMQSAKRVGERYLAEKFRKPPVLGPGADNRALNFNMFGGGPRPGTVDGGEFVQTPNAGGGSSPVAGRLVGGAMKAISTGAQVGAAAASGGTSAAVIAMGKVAGKTVLQRAVVSGGSRAMKSLTSGSESASTPPERSGRPNYTGFGRQIVVDGQGTGKIAPAKAPERGGVYSISSMPKVSRSPISSTLRSCLEAAAKGGPSK